MVPRYAFAWSGRLWPTRICICPGPALNHAQLMPVVFVGHGNPMNAVTPSRYGDAWAELARAMPKPKAIVCVSAHWYVRGTKVTAMERPETIHDFGGFPKELFEVQYPAPGEPQLARQIADLLKATPVELDEESWGLDHGTWSVLVHMYPEAVVPVVQLSIDRREPALFHYELGSRLSALREEGVLILASGNLVHNLHAYSWGAREEMAFDWAREFESLAKELLASHNHEPLIAYETLGRAADLSIPTPDHYLPFLYAISLCRGGESLSYPVDGFDGGSISMLSIRIG
uniref:Catalytic LigB subunit of aromatic ring-opening dioxygenase family protein n=1 Tax=uncultured bacterium 5G4 TaxID=1701326 RepID=A0A166H2P1_9BACT|nr:catalytic LigB subunit of aromatic ring-opening dioxygenase family protein [uncultured bacterium 5G4]